MKLVCISDVHCEPINLPPGDLLVFAGDMTDTGREVEVIDMLDWLQNMGKLYTHGVVMVAGNHDFLFERDSAIARQMCSDRGIRYLCETGCEIGGLHFWGSPYTRRFGRWAFMYDECMDNRIWKRIPEDTDVLITHQPPLWILDNVDGRSCGSHGLREEVVAIKPKLHVFGHIHAGYGMMDIDGTRYVNAAVCNEAYDPVNRPQEVEI